MRMLQVAALGPRTRPDLYHRMEEAGILARAKDQRNRPLRGRAGPGRAISMRRLRRFWRHSARPGVSRWARTHSAHFLHAFPLVWPNHHNKLRHENVVLHRAAR